jgi:peptide deformylase
MIFYKDIIKDDNPNLRIKSLDVLLPLNEEDINTILKLNEYLENGYDETKCELYKIRPGVGLAAIQIDVPKKIFVILGADEKGEMHHYAVINPKITSHSEQLTYLENGEGWLSVDRPIEGLVHRPKRITVKCHLFDFDERIAKETTLRLKGYMALVFHHEYDHLYGRLFFDRINKDNPYYVPYNSTPIE